MRIAFLSLVLILSSPAVANGNAASPDSASQVGAGVAEQKEPRKICRRIDATESRLSSKKVCLTAEEWKQRNSSIEYRN